MEASETTRIETLRRRILSRPATPAVMEASETTRIETEVDDAVLFVPVASGDGGVRNYSD